MKSERFRGALPFACADVLLLRAPALPYHRADETRFNLTAEPDESNALVRYIRRLGRDPLVREAVELSSPSLSGLIERITDGAAPPKVKTLRRAALSLARYQLRMSGRATPFGLVAGIAPAQLGSAPSVRLGHAHRKVSRPDMAWLMRLVCRLERRSDVLPTLRVMANGARVVRGDRVALTFASDTSAADEPEAETVPAARKRGVSLRYTAVVADMLHAAKDAIAVPDLEYRVECTFPGAPPGAVRRVLEQLIEHEFLLTDLRPPLDRADPLDYVLERLAGVGYLPEKEALREIQGRIVAYNAMPLGRGQGTLHALQARMRAVCDVEKPLQVDLALDADICLPGEVGREVERAAAVAWRISRDQRGSTPLGRYHQEFLERYGIGRAVPLLELLDPETGLDAPPGYLAPPARRRAVEVIGDPGENQRDRLLLELAGAATAQGRREAVLEEETIAALSNEAQSPETVPPACELFMQLVSPSAEALATGEFRLVLAYAASTAGATFGRFAHLLGDHISRVAAMVRGAGTYDPHALRVNLIFQPGSARSVNIALTPQWLDYRIAVGVGPDGQQDRNLSLEDLAVGATLERLYLVSRQLGLEVVPTASSMINVAGLAPNLARFLQEIGKEGPRTWVPWSWGAADQAPFLPRIRYGRSVLCPAMWRLSGSLRGSESDDSWRREFQDWRSLWRLPSHVVASFGDLQIPLDLDDPLHLRVLRHEAVRRPDLRLQELPGGEDYTDAWLTGPGGSHRCELVVPLLRRTGPTSVSTQRPVFAPARDSHMFPQPGGEWLYAKLYSSPGNQNELLLRHLAGLLDRGLVSAGQVDRWFFVRYNDPDPHLRLRFHGPADRLWASALPMIHDWAQRLRQERLANRLVIDGYDPELERYGGPSAMADAERAFAADSAATLTLLQILSWTDGDLDPVLLAAASLVDLAKGFDLRHPRDGTPAQGCADWLATAVTRDEYRGAFTSRRDVAMALIDPDHGWGGLLSRPYGEAVCRAWTERRAALTSYARSVQALTGEGRCWTPVERIVISMLHMHCNRLLGTNRDTEGKALAIASGALRAHRDRARYLS